MESSNPTLSEKVFTEAQVRGGAPTMTIQGTVNKAFVLLAIVMATAFWSWSKVASGAAQGNVMLWVMGAGIVGFILALVTTFKRSWSPVTAPLDAACQGLFLGAISVIFEMRYPGIVMNAVGLTFAVMFAMLMGYKAGWLQATPGLRKGLMVAMIGLMVFYAVVWIASFFGIAPPAFINGNGPLGIAFSLVVVGMAAMFLVLDFDLIEQGARQNLDKYMEWYCSFSLMVTLIWLYMEILRLLSKLRSR